MSAAVRDVVRLEALSDGVFAIALTLLSLDLKVPVLAAGATPAELADALIKSWPTYIAFVISFGTVLVLWMGHHALFQFVRRADGFFLIANGVVLLIVTVVPFPTALVARYLLEPGASTAMAAYAGVMLALNLAFNLLWLAASHNRRLLRPDVPQSQLGRIRRRLVLGVPAYLMVGAVAYFSAMGALILCLALWGIWGLMVYENVEKSVI